MSNLPRVGSKKLVEAQTPVTAAKPTVTRQPSPVPAQQPEPQGRLFNEANVAHRARHVSDKPSASPAQLKLHTAAIEPAALPPKEERPLVRETPIGAAFNGLRPKAINADVKLLEGNVESWNAMYHVFNTAPAGLDASYFIMQRDVFGFAFLGNLLRKAKQGHPVRLMLDASGDAFGKMGFTQTARGQDYLQELVNTGHATVRVYHPLHKKVPKQLLKWTSALAISCNHDKILRSDTMAITGGRNISKDYFVDPADRSDVYRDCDVLVHGREASRDFRSAFENEFNREDLHYLVTPDLFGNLRRRDGELLGAAAMMDLWMKGAPPSAEEKAQLRTESGKAQRATDLVQRTVAALRQEGVDRPLESYELASLEKMAGELVGYVELLGSARAFDPRGVGPQTVKVLDRTSVANGSVDDINNALIQLANGAKERILIQNPYVVLTEGAITALEAAGKRGVKIDLVTNSPDSSDSVITQAFFVHDWPKVLARVPNMRIFVFSGEQKLHAKTATADGQVSVVGSFNLDYLSQEVNSEIMLAAKSPKLASELEASWQRDLKDPAQKVREYTIQRQADGTPVLKDGKPIVTFGAHNHVSKWKWFQYQVLGWVVDRLKDLPQLDTLRRAFAPRG